MTTIDAIRIFAPALITFLLGMVMTPFLTHFLYKYKFWKPRAGKIALDGAPAEVFNKLHELREVGVPRVGGILVWGSVIVGATLLEILSRTTPEAFGTLAFVSREQTWVPLAALLAGALVGFIDDFYEVRGRGGLQLRIRLLVVGVISLLCAWWFYDKLGVSAISFPFLSEPLSLGVWFIPFFMFVALCLYAGGVIDGIDGLSGGVYASIFGAYAAIAFFQQQMDLAALCAAITGGLLAFLWFNIPPARFYLSETGTMGLTLALTVIAFLADMKGEGGGIMVLPVVTFLLAATVVSNAIQIVGKKILHRKIFKIAPLHHHFEAIGWPPYKVVMRYWVVSVVCAVVGISLTLL